MVRSWCNGDAGLGVAATAAGIAAGLLALHARWTEDEVAATAKAAVLTAGGSEEAGVAVAGVLWLLGRHEHEGLQTMTVEGAPSLNIPTLELSMEGKAMKQSVEKWILSLTKLQRKWNVQVAADTTDRSSAAVLNEQLVSSTEGHPAAAVMISGEAALKRYSDWRQDMAYIQRWSAAVLEERNIVEAMSKRTEEEKAEFEKAKAKLETNEASVQLLLDEAIMLNERVTKNLVQDSASQGQDVTTAISTPAYIMIGHTATNAGKVLVLPPFGFTLHCFTLAALCTGGGLRW